uniref:NADH-ubiquinone oxidoreductase chain 5 n=1 Tax=Pseudocolochirus violaceus TaxID=2528974 RepID=A0A7G7YDQ3_9ECHN|nr:NADH dehydrogenase subunit 5 [Pseudocolochirus violaceus]QNH92623.1 NADH dehydrogenase subunit 5 [Pseudocolochirus violaceus]
MNINLSHINTTLTLLIFLTLIISSSFSNKNLNNNNIRDIENNNISLLSLKNLSIIATINLFIFIVNNNSLNLILINWNNSFNINFNLNIFLDNNFIFFLTTAIIVSWSIIEFSIYYMENDPLANNFYRLLTIFLLNMLILTSSNNLFIFFIGWEGVGFLSFLLISWWFTRNNANTAALQAIIYNRIGDIGIITLIASILITSNGWNITNISLLNNSLNWQNLILITALLAAIGKSAQFSLHPWLPAAMEGPTPVSALLHSSTMVVAGVFLLIRISELTTNTLFLLLCSITGVITAIFAATSAFRQHDIKKIIAYSTTSQLGLMVLSIGLGYPNIALFHICTHAFFKAMLFLCSGSIIHSHNNEQDLRKISNINNSLPITSACLILGSIALMGIPFLSGFFSKDLILESIINIPTNTIFFILATTATFLTAAYSFRIITLCFQNNTNNNPLNPTNEENPSLYHPLTRLTIGTIVYGWLLSNWLINIPPLFPLPIIKNTPLTITIFGAIIASTIILTINTNIKTTFFTNTWFFNNILHTTTNNIISNTALIMTTRTFDRGWNESIGGQGIFLLNKKITQASNSIQSGYIKQYLLSIFIILLSSLIITNL